MKYILLELFVHEGHPELFELYKSHIEKHNNELENNAYPNSGFDLFIPNDIEFTTPFQTKMVDLLVNAQMWEFTYKGPDSELDTELQPEQLSQSEQPEYFPSGYYLYPRSSIAKTNLMMANHVGIIDSGYRNSLLTAFRYLPVEVESSYKVKFGTRLVQICHPSLLPIYVRLLTSKEALTRTTRTGGFGSTGGTV